MLNNKIKIAFIDRNIVINKNSKPHEYITKLNDFKFNKGIFELLVMLIQKRYKITIITNKRGIARGILTGKNFKLYMPLC